MKTKLSITFEQEGINNADMAVILSSHNGGKASVSLSDIKGFMLCRAARYPNLYPNLKVEESADSVIHVYEDGENLTFSIQENEYYTLEDVENGGMVGEDALLLNPVYQRNK